ncbi:hypothetical protein [Leisingera sp. JC1]|uniref:hypothetical protein n=1 Tax=Leisingera sp. JC1 TaxID=1855282 RepID=UPI0008030810|nr:hypothetical protein [Leisingera sp. JC1]OBY28102.1 hypothetical protein A9D60_12500 [Leisingera sp. JC1]
MQRIFLTAAGGFALVNAAYMWTATQHWYATVPGVQQTGPLNIHFAKDVALAFLSSGLALAWAGLKADRSAAVFGSAWLVFHALFHIWIWTHHGFPADLIALTNLTGIQLPAAAALWAALTLQRQALPQTQQKA